jgi:hypothetical protein
MQRRKWLVLGGMAFSLVLVVILLWRLDWPSFWAALQALEIGWVLTAAAVVEVGVGVRALRLYGVDETPAIAYSIVIQVLSFLIIILQGSGALLSYGLRFSDLGGKAAAC